jgi:hypothetical protein
MGGSKTRFGFVGGSDPPDTEDPQSARTLFGHDRHLQLPPDFTPPQPPGLPPPLPSAPEPWAVRAPVPAPMVEEESTSPIPARRPTGPRQSRLARFLGRWTRSGRFVSKSRMDFEPEEELQLPRDTTSRNVFLVLLVAVLTFGLTFAIVKLRQRSAPPAPEPQAQTATPPPAPPAATAAAPAVPPAPAGPAPAAAQPAVSAPAPAQPTPQPPAPAARGLGGGTAAPRSHKAGRASHPLAEPPAHLKNELLPFAP